MSEFAMQMTTMVAVTACVAILLTSLAFREGLLRLRPEPRRCPSCGQRLRARTCWSCTRSSRG